MNRTENRQTPTPVPDSEEKAAQQTEPIYLWALIVVCGERKRSLKSSCAQS